MAITINSDTLIPTESSFKVSAGPGAGKTHWLSLHIKNVLAHGRSLGISRKIACISYTNVGVETILERIPNDNSLVDVCTIHSFLYNQVVKPFLYIDAEKWGIDINNLRVSPSEPFQTKAFANIIIGDIKALWVNPNSLVKGLIKCTWRSRAGNTIKFTPRYLIKNEDKYGHETKYSVPQLAYDKFVELKWGKGILSYDDVLYLAIEILKQHPYIYRILAARYPYFFVDEFQDTIPTIMDFIKSLAQYGVKIGVVGDKAQTIYDFIGASVANFDSFTVQGQIDYEIHGNRRSSPEIVNLLNCIRTDFVQTPIGTTSGIKHIFLVGDKLNAYQKAIEISCTDDVHSLAFPNIIANSLKYKTEADVNIKGLIDSDFDSDFQRATEIKIYLKAVEYAFNNDFKEAWFHLDLLDNNREHTISVLRMLLNHRNEYKDGSLYDFYEFVKHNINQKLTLLKKGRIKDFYLSHSYLEMALSMKVSDCQAMHKTIHKAKGEEYDNILLIINEPADIKVLSSPDLSNNSTDRVYYVGMSRAKNSLFINVESISEESKLILQKLPIDIIEL